MRIYNGTKSQLDLPLTGTQRIQIPSRSVSGDVLPNNEFLSLLVTSYDYSEIALIVSGPYEINMCSQVSGAVGFVVSSLEEAIARFTPKTSTPAPEPKVVEEVEEEKEEEVNPEPEAVTENVESPFDKTIDQIFEDVAEKKETPAPAEEPEKKPKRAKKTTKKEKE